MDSRFSSAVEDVVHAGLGFPSAVRGIVAEIGVPPAVRGIVPAEDGFPPATRGVVPTDSRFSLAVSGVVHTDSCFPPTASGEASVGPSVQCSYDPFTVSPRSRARSGNH